MKEREHERKIEEKAKKEFGITGAIAKAVHRSSRARWVPS